jgi:putative MATE family efflux protein
MVFKRYKDVNTQIYESSILKSTISIGLPILLSMTFQAFYLLVDQYFLMGVDRSNKYIAGIVQVVFPFFFLINAFSSIIYFGVTTYGSRTIGEKNIDNYKKLVSNTIFITIFLSLFIVLTGFIFSENILFLAGARDNIKHLAIGYFKFYLLSVPFQLCASGFDGFFQAKCNTKPIMISQIGGILIKILLTPVLIYGLGIIPRLGIPGGALAIVAGNLSRFLLIFYFFQKHIFKELIKELKGQFYDKNTILTIFKNGFPMAISTLVISFSSIIINNLLASLDESALSALSAVSRISNFAVLPASAIATTTMSMVGQLRGLGNWKRISNVINNNCVFSFSITTSIGIILFLSARPLICIFTDNVQVIEMAKNFIQIEALSYGFLSIEILTRQALVGIGFRKQAIFQVILRFFAIYLPVSFVLVNIFHFSVTGIWIAIAFTNTVSGILGLAWIKYNIKKAMKKLYDVSVIIPSYNRAALLDLTLNSLVKQDYDNTKFEVIIIDDGSNDNTIEVTDKYKSKLKLTYIYQPHEGYRVALARNKGIRTAEGEIIVLLDSGMVVPEYFITNHFKEHIYFNQSVSKKKLAVIGYVYGYDSEDNDNSMEYNFDFNKSICIIIEKMKKYEIYQDSREVVYKEINDKINLLHAPWALFWTTNVSFKKDIFLDVNLFDEDFKSWGVEDIELGYRLFKYGCTFALSRAACGIHYPHDREKTNNKETNNNNKLLFFSKHPFWDVELFCHNWALNLNKRINTLMSLNKNNIKNRNIHKYLNPQSKAYLKDFFGKHDCIIIGSQENSFLKLFNNPTVFEISAQLYLKAKKKKYSKKTYNLLGIQTPFEDSKFGFYLLTDIINELDDISIQLLFKEAFRISNEVYILNYKDMNLPNEITIAKEQYLGENLTLYFVRKTSSMEGN